MQRILAAKILATSDPELLQKLKDYTAGNERNRPEVKARQSLKKSDTKNISSRCRHTDVSENTRRI